MARSPFAVFRKHQKVLMVVLTLLAMFAFVVLDAVTAASEIPMSLWAVIAGAIGAMIFWLLGSSGGKGTEWALVGALLGVVVVLILPRFFGERGAVSSSAGSLSEEELAELMRYRRTANFIVRDVYAAGHPYPQRLSDISPEFAEMENSSFSRQFLNMYQQRWQGEVSQFQFGALSESGAVTSWLLTHEADEMGVSISDEAVTNYLQVVADGKLRGQDLTRIRKEHGLSESQLYDVLRYELKAAKAAELSVPPLLATPEDLWELYRRFNVRQELVLTAVPVERFVERDQEPARSELLEFFEKYKNQYPMGAEPGFYQDREVQLAYVEVDFESIRNRMFSEPITEEQLQVYYQEHRDEFRNPAFQQPGTPSSGTGAPAAGPPLTSPGGAGAQPGSEAPPAGAPSATDPGAAAPEAAPAAADPSSASPPGDGQAALPSESELVHIAFVAQDDPPTSESGQPAADAPPAVPPADATAAEPAASPDQTPPTGGQAAAGLPTAPARQRPLPPPLPENPITEFRDFEDVREQIRSRLEQQRDDEVRQEIDRLLDVVDDRMEKLGRAHKAPPGHPDQITAAQVSDGLQEFAKGQDLRYVVTDHLTYDELLKETIGQMTDIGAEPFSGSPPLATQIFQSHPEQKYLRMRFRDLTGDEIIMWKIDDVAAHVPQFTDEGIEQQVLEAWRLTQARPKAEERAEALAKLVREHAEKDMQQALAGATLTGEAGSLEPTVRNTRSFTWLRQSSAPNPSQLTPPMQIEHSAIDGVEQPGEEFMRTIFNDLEEGEVGVVPNADKSIYYVVKVVNRSTATEAGRQVLLADLLRAPLFESQQSPYMGLLGNRQQGLGQAWVQRLYEKYSVQRNRPLDDERSQPE